MTHGRFRVLYRHFLFHIVDFELISAHGDVSRLLGQFAAFLAAYSGMLAVSARAYAQMELPPADVLVAAWGIEHFLISSTMLAVVVLTVLCWDSTYPDRRDVLVLGPLPVPPRTVLLARIAALLTAFALVVLAINVFTGLAYPFVLGAVAGSAASIARSFAAYWTTMLLAGAFILAALLCLQGISAQLLPRRYFLRLSGAMQLGAVCTALAVFFLQPDLARPADLQAAENQRALAWLPSYWFLGVFQQLNGSAHAATATLAVRGWIALLAAISGASAAYALSYIRTIRRIVDDPDILPGAASRRWFPAFGNGLNGAIVRFSARTLLRSRQHRLILAVYLGVAAALAAAYGNLLFGHGQIARRHPNGPMLAASIVLLCFSVVGARVVFAMPLALRANWIFRLTATRPASDYLRAVRRALLFIAVFPVCALTAAVCFYVWPPWQAVAHLIVLSLLGSITVDWALRGFSKIPFACAYLPGKANVHVAAGAYAIVLLAFTGLGVRFELRALQTPFHFSTFAAFLMVIAIWAWRRNIAAQSSELQFDEIPEQEILALQLHRDGVLMEPLPPNRAPAGQRQRLQEEEPG